MNGYKHCPNDECQGLIAPDQMFVSGLVRQPKGKNIFRMVRHHYIWCENCGTAFHLVEDQYCNEITKTESFREKDHPVEAGKIKKRIPGLQLQSV